MLFEQFILVVGCIFVHLLLVYLLYKMSLVMRVSLPFHFLLALGRIVPAWSLLEEELLDLLA